MYEINFLALCEIYIHMVTYTKVNPVMFDPALRPFT